MQIINTRWKRWAAGFALFLAAYAALGFGLVPVLVRHQLVGYANDTLQRQASVADVRFNPFTLRLEAAGLALAEADGTPLFGIGHLAIELQWRSLVRRAWSFAEIRVTAPEANLVIAPDGRFNLAQLLDTMNREPRDASADTALPRVVIEQFTLEQGKLQMHDRRAGYDNAFTPIDFALTDFSTLPEQGDTYTFTAQSARGGKLRWKGHASVNPIRGGGEVSLENASLPQLAVYLKSYTRATVAAGLLNATIPYEFAYADGKLEARLAGARVQLRDLALAREARTDSFASLTRLEVNGIDADLVRRQATVADVRADGGRLAASRDAKGQLDLANLMVAAAQPPRAAASAPKPAPVAVAVDDWKVNLKQVTLDQVAVNLRDETVQPALQVDAGKVGLRMQLAAAQSAGNFQLKIDNAALSIEGLKVSSGARAPLTLARVGLTDGVVDVAARRVGVGRVYAEGGQVHVVRDRHGQVDVVRLLPKPGAVAPQPTGGTAQASAPWAVVLRTVEIAKLGVEVDDEDSGVAVHATDVAASLEGAGSDLKQPVKFSVALALREGGKLSALGTVVPATAAVQADVRASQLAIKPLQPLLGQYLKLKIAGGHVSAQGRLTSRPGGAKGPALQYAGSVDVASLVLNEEDGDLFLAWKNFGAAKLTAGLNPNRLDVPELRIVDADARLGIEEDRSFNAVRLLVKPAAAASASASAKLPPSAPAAAADDGAFPVRIRRVRISNAKLDFTDLSLRPQFAAKIYEMNGAINGLSSRRDSRSQVELDGRVDEFGLARVRGELNPFAASENTDINAVFKNVDMVPASPYSAKFAGYRIAEGKISLDLEYKVRAGQLVGANKIVLDNLTLGERVESPDALKLPLQLAIAILKDSDGRIDLDLPISGDINDPKVSYGAIIWKAIGALLTKIVTAPFRALGAMLGLSGGDKLEAIEFDPGSDKLLPPEREKLKQVAQLLAKRAQLKLSVPGQYSEAADGAALRQRAVRLEVARRAGIRIAEGESPGPMDLRDRAVRSAIRDLYAERFGEAELDKQKKAAEVAAPATAASGKAAAPAKLPLLQRVGKMIQGEPQVADPTAFYNGLQERLNREQAVPADALPHLGAQRASAILAALNDDGVAASRAVAAPPEKIAGDAGKAVPLKLGLAVN